MGKDNRVTQVASEGRARIKLRRSVLIRYVYRGYLLLYSAVHDFMITTFSVFSLDMVFLLKSHY